MTTTRMYLVTMRGRSSFPIDMLRYDQCIPASEQDAEKITATFTYGERGEEQTVTLRAWHERWWAPTLGRWNSFGWEVVKVEDLT